MVPRLASSPKPLSVAQRLFALFALAAALYLLLAPLFQSPWYANDEIDRYPFRLEALWTHFSWSNPLPRWIPELAGAHGYPLFVFFNPLLTLASVPFRAAGADPLLATKLATSAFLVFGAFWTQRLGQRLWHSEAGGFLAAILYISAPYTFSNLYLRGDLAELVASMLFPAVLHAYLGLMETGRTRHFLGLALGMGALVPAHAFSAVLFVAGFGVALAILAWRQGRIDRRFAAATAALALGVLLAGFYWLPVFVELPTVSTDALFHTDAIRRHGLRIDGLWDHEAPSAVAGRMMSYGPMLPALAVLGASARGGQPRRPRRGLLWMFLALGLVAGLLSLRAFAPVYDFLPGLDRIAFPWRWLTVGSLSLALVGGRVATLSPHRGKAKQIALMLMLAPLPLMHLAQPLIAPTGVAANQFDLQGRAESERLLFDYGEFYPRAAFDRLPPPSARPVSASRGCGVDLEDDVRLWPLRTEVHAEVEGSCTLTFRRFAWRGFGVFVDGDTAMGEVDPNGRIRVLLPEGEHRAVVKWISTPSLRLAPWLSLAGIFLWSLVAFGSVVSAFWKRRTHR